MIVNQFLLVAVMAINNQVVYEVLGAFPSYKRCMEERAEIVHEAKRNGITLVCAKRDVV